MSREDADTLGIQSGEPVVLSNDLGSLRGRCKLAPLRPGNVQAYWPEANHMIRRGVLDPACEMPDYNALVRVERGAGGR